MGLLSFFGGNSSSSSSRTSATDNRVGADGQAIALGSSASLTINQESPELVALMGNLASEAFNFARESQDNFKDQSTGALATVEAAVSQTPGFGPESFQKIAGFAAIALVASVIVWKIS